MLNIQQLSLAFKGQTGQVKQVFKGLDFSLDPGSFTVIIGANGSGKSTLLNLIAGSLLPDEGRISINGIDVTRFSEELRSRFISRVFQHPHLGTAGELTVLENMRLSTLHGKVKSPFRRMGKMNEEEIKKHVEGLQMGLENTLHRSMEQLSGGQRQALSVLMASLPDVPLLLMDEPAAALDPSAGDAVMELAAGRIKERGRTTVLVTHNMKHAVVYGNRLVQLQHGKIIRDISGEEKKSLRPEMLHAWFER
jgi:putative ABC transport system ATP-binding protein